MREMNFFTDLKENGEEKTMVTITHIDAQRWLEEWVR